MSPILASRLVGRRLLPLALAASAVLMLTVVIGTVAAGPPNTYTACLAAKQGTLYNVAIGTSPSGVCKSSDATVSWNQVGPTGPTGATGASGVTGASGASGATGATGAPGTPYTAEWDFSTGTCTGTSGWDCDDQTHTIFPAGTKLTVTDVEIDSFTNVDSGCTSAVFYAYADLVGHNGYYLGIINFDPTKAVAPLTPINLGAPYTIFGASGLAAVSEFCEDNNATFRIPPVVSGKIFVKVEIPSVLID